MIDKITLSEGPMDLNRNHEKFFKFKSLSLSFKQMRTSNGNRNNNRKISVL
jgi:hypothetical protein